MRDGVVTAVGCLWAILVLGFWALVVWGLIELIMLIQRS